MPQGDPSQVLRIDSESTAIDAIHAALLKAYEGQSIKLDFDSWPVLRLKYVGEKFDGTITPDIAQAIVELQETLNRAYALAVNNTSNLRSLSEETRRDLQVAATVERGSSLVEIDLGDWATNLSTALVNKMTGSEIVVAVLGAAVVVTAGWLVKSHLRQRSEEKKLSLENAGRLDLSREETRRLEVVTEALKASAVVREVNGYAEGVRDALLKSAFDADAMIVQDELSVSSDDARKTYRSKLSKPIEVQLNGTYSVKSFAWTDDFQTARVRVQREDDGVDFTADLPVSALTAPQKARFKDATFDHVRVYLVVNATVLNDAITSATIVSVDEQPPVGPGAAADHQG